MRDLTISSLIVLLLIGCWCVFDNYSHSNTEVLSNIIIEDIIPLTEKEEWNDAAELYNHVEDKWNNYKKTALSFLENDQISELDLCIARAEKYIEAKDVSNSAGELCSIAKQLQLLDLREKVTLSNIL